MAGQVSNPVPNANNPPAPPRPCVEVAIAIVFGPDGKLLVCKRKADAVLGGYWEFPGGKCNPGESPAACALREVEEETALIVEVLHPMPIIQHDYPHASVRLHPFVCQWRSGKVELREVAEARWIVREELHAYRFPEANSALVQAIASGGARTD